MMELIKTELKKIFRSRALWGFLLLLAAADIYKINQMHRQEMTQIDGYKKVYAKVCGKITEEKIRFVIDYYRECAEKIHTGNYSTEYNKDRYTGYDFGDYHIMAFFYEELQHAFEYHEEMEALCKQWERKIEICQKYNQSYQENFYKKLLLNYRRRSIDSYYDMSSAEKFLSYDFSTILVIAAVFFAVPKMIFYERKNRMWLFLKTMPEHSGKIMGAKLAAVTWFVFLLTMFFGILDFFCFHVLYSIEGLLQPLYSIESYQYTAFNGTVLQFIFVHQAVKYLSFLFFAYGCLLCSFFIRDQAMAVLLSFAGFTGFVLFCLYSECFLNPIALFGNQEWIKTYQEIRIFSYPISTYPILYMFAVGMDLLMAIGILISAARHGRPKKIC